VVRIDDVVALLEHAHGGLELYLGAVLYRIFGCFSYFGDVCLLESGRPLQRPSAL
jgi:hypothetical protein